MVITSRYTLVFGLIIFAYIYVLACNAIWFQERPYTFKSGTRFSGLYAQDSWIVVLVGNDVCGTPFTSRCLWDHTQTNQRNNVLIFIWFKHKRWQMFIAVPCADILMMWVQTHDRLSVSCLTSLSGIFHSYGDVTNTGEQRL